MPDRTRWHLSEEAIDEYLDRALGPTATVEAERHLRSCPECGARLRRATRLFRRLESAAVPRLEHDLSAGVVASLQKERTSRRRWNWILLAEAACAAAALVVLSLRFEGWQDAVLHHPAYQSLREDGLRLAAQAAAWMAPFFELIPAYSSRLTSIRITLPHSEGPALWWAGLAVAALTLGLVGNTLLLRSANDYAGKARVGTNPSDRVPLRSGRQPLGRRK